MKRPLVVAASLAALLAVSLTGCETNRNAVQRLSGPSAVETSRSGSLSSAMAPGIIVGLVWDDANCNGIREPGESGVAGVGVVLSAGACPGDLVTTTVTDANGFYGFTDLAPGVYCVLVKPDCPTSGRNPVQVELTEAEPSVKGLEFGFCCAPPPPPGGRAFHMEVSGASVSGTGAKHNFKLSCDPARPGQSLEIVLPEMIDPFTGQTVSHVKFKTDRGAPGATTQNTCFDDPHITPDDPAVAFDRIVGFTIGTMDHGVAGVYRADYEFRDGGKTIGNPNGDAGYWKITVVGGPHDGTVVAESDPTGEMRLLSKGNHKAKPNAW